MGRGVPRTGHVVAGADRMILSRSAEFGFLALGCILAAGCGAFFIAKILG